MSEKLSTIEQLHLGHNKTPYLAQQIQQQRVRESKWEAGATQRHFDGAARELPDELFESRADVIAARQLATTASHRYDLVAKSKWRTDFPLISDVVAAELLAAEAELETAALDDVLNGDAEFSRALAVMERVEISRRRKEALRLASGVLSKDRQRLLLFLDEKARTAEARVNELLLALKRGYLTQHPELVNSAGS